MKTIILGKEGNQPFKINADANGVSRRHAQITITDGNDWYIEDLNSTNGTYIRDEVTGCKIPVAGKKRITPMTFIFLGPDNSRGCCFFAKQADSYGDFTEEHIFLQSKNEELDRKSKELDNKIKKIRLIGPFVLIISVFAITFIPAISSLLGENAMTIRLILSPLSGIIPVLYDGSARKKELQEERELWNYCPNPCCSNKQTSKEIRDMKCSKCKK